MALSIVSSSIITSQRPSPHAHGGSLLSPYGTLRTTGSHLRVSRAGLVSRVAADPKTGGTVPVQSRTMLRMRAVARSVRRTDCLADMRSRPVDPSGPERTIRPSLWIQLVSNGTAKRKPPEVATGAKRPMHLECVRLA